MKDEVKKAVIEAAKLAAEQGGTWEWGGLAREDGLVYLYDKDGNLRCVMNERQYDKLAEELKDE